MTTKHILLPFAALVMLVVRAEAALWTFGGVIDGFQEVPPTGSPAIGFAGGDYDDVTNILNIVAFADGFSTAIVGSHIHGPAAPGANAGILIDLGVGPGFGYQYYRALQFTLTPTQETHFLAGLTYVNIHSQQNPTGEIRGQLNPVPEPATMIALGLGAAVLIKRRRKERIV